VNNFGRSLAVQTWSYRHQHWFWTAKLTFSGWFARRKLKLQWTQLSDDMNPIIWLQFLKVVCGDHVHNILVSNMKQSTEAIFTIISLACSRIRRVCVRNCDNLAVPEMLLDVSKATVDSVFIDNDLNRAVRADICLPQLRWLHLNCNGNGGAALNKFLAANRCLEQVYIMDANIDAAGVDSLCQSASSLRELSLCHCTLSSALWQQLILGCRHLKQLMLQECEGLREADVRTFTKECPSLDTLLLYCKFTVTDPTLRAIAEHCGLRLRHLWLVNVRCAGDSAIGELTHKCTNIETMGLLRVKGASLTALALFIGAQVNLRELTLSCVCVDDRILCAAVNNAEWLTHLGLHEVNGHCTEAMLGLLLTQCKALKTLCVEEQSRLLTPELREAWGRQLPPLQIVPEPVYPPSWDSPLWSESIY
jgi:hypothetical protein